MDGDSLQPVVEVLAEFRRSTAFSRSRLVRPEYGYSPGWDGCLHPHEFPSWMTRSSFTWKEALVSVISSKKIVPRRPPRSGLCGAYGAGKGSLHVAEELALQIPLTESRS